MAGIQKLSSQVIDYAERVTEMANAAEGKHNQRTSRTTRWLLLPASGAALYALLKSDAFSRQARGVMDEAKERASELPDDLLARVRQNGSRRSSAAASSSTSRTTSSTRKRSPARKRSSSRKTKAAA